MGDPRGFLKTQRSKERERPVDERVKDWRELTIAQPEAELRAQAARCMDCGVPFCHSGCPLGNLIPEWNDHAYKGRLDEAAAALLSTNNFPEVTSRVCPAPCEASCVLAIENTPVAIKSVEKAIAEHVMSSPELLRPRVATVKSGRRVAIIGSGPAGLAAAQQLARSGHEVTVFEKDDRIGGLLRYGIPDFKMEKGILDARVAQMEAEGVVFRAGVNAGVDVSPAELLAFDAVVLSMGARVPRDLPIPGRDLEGVHFAMDYLTQQNKRIAGDDVDAPGPTSRRDAAAPIVAKGKHVIVIGGGDTGSDCVGTAVRQGAASVTQLEILAKPPLVRAPQNPWPEWPLVLRTSSSQEEGCERDWSIMTRAFQGENGAVQNLEAVRVERAAGAFREVANGRVTLRCDLALLAMGFVGPEKSGLLDGLGVALDARGNVTSDAAGATSVAGVFAAGDASRGQSLVVWAIADGRRAAKGVDAYLRAGKARGAA